MSPYNEAYQRLERMRDLWRELQQTPPKTPRYEALVKQIRQEADAYQALVEAQQPKKPGSNGELSN